MQRGFIRTSAGQLHALEAGRGEPVVMMQTLPLGSTQLEPLLTDLGADYRCIAIDLMGYAPSDLRSRAWSVREYADNILEACDALGLGRFRLLGGHLSGLVAADIAARHPERLVQLVLDGVYAWTAEEQQPYRAGSGSGAHDWGAGGEPLARRWDFFLSLLRRFDPALAFTDANAARLARLGLAFLSLPVSPASMETTFEYDLLAVLPQIRTPTLLMRSPTDSLARFNARALSLLPNAREHAFEGVNPLQQVARPERIGEYAAVLRGFFQTGA